MRPSRKNEPSLPYSYKNPVKQIVTVQRLVLLHIPVQKQKNSEPKEIVLEVQIIGPLREEVQNTPDNHIAN